MTRRSTWEKLQALAEVDLALEGDWSAVTANERCRLYAKLVTKLGKEQGK